MPRRSERLNGVLQAAWIYTNEMFVYAASLGNNLSGKGDLLPKKADLLPKKADLLPGKADLLPEKADLLLGKADSIGMVGVAMPQNFAAILQTFVIASEARQSTGRMDCHGATRLAMTSVIIRTENAPIVIAGTTLPPCPNHREHGAPGGLPRPYGPRNDRK
ncbi:MAG: hypothetical protein LBP58_05355 [Azoarcus sp.]|nr:hypothetical protein [Azoarcus sp.]